MQLIECVPNFSEGVNAEVIEQIAAAVRSVAGVKLLNVDPGKDANRTVFTFAGEPALVVEAAFNAIKTAGELIDMRTQKGEHPRMGATDVCPLIPISNVSMEETAAYAHQLATRVGDELGIPVYLYENSQPDKARSNLSIIRAGEYEGFFNKIKQSGWAPDFGPAEMDAKRGATVIGARDFLVAYNINLNTKLVNKANAIAYRVRESGAIQREGDPITGAIVYDEHGKPKRQPGLLKGVKAIGWYIDEYNAAQVSTNITNLRVTPVHRVFDEVSNIAAEYGAQVTGSELIGLIPLQAMLDAGRYFATKQQQQTETLTEQQLIEIAINYMGLNELASFKANARIIEYVLRGEQ